MQAVLLFVVTLALALLVVSATLVATTVWLPLAAGAVYRPEVEIVPVVEFPPETPSTPQVTAVLVEPETVAVNCCVAFATSVAEAGVMLTLTGVTAEETVIVSEDEK